MKFKNQVAYLEMNKKESAVAEFEFEGDVAEIEDWKANCSCSSIKVEGNKLLVTYVNGGNATFDNQIRVFLNDGKPLKTINNGIMDYNPLKESVFLHVTGVAL